MQNHDRIANKITFNFRFFNQPIVTLVTELKHQQDPHMIPDPMRMATMVPFTIPHFDQPIGSVIIGVNPQQGAHMMRGPMQFKMETQLRASKEQN